MKNRNKRKTVLIVVMLVLFIIGAAQIVVKNNMYNANYYIHKVKDEALKYIYFPKKNSLDKEEILVCIDAGHGGKDPGAMNKKHMEKDDTILLANSVKKYLEKNNIRVMMTREDDTFLTPKKRAKIANKADADLMISIHRNSLPSSKKTNGIDIYINSMETEKDYALGNALKYHLERAGEMKVNSVSPGSATDKNENYTVVGATKMTAALIEMGYITNKNDNAYFEESVNSYAIAISDGIIQYLEEGQSDN